MQIGNYFTWNENMMRKVHVNTEREYDVLIGQGILHEVGRLCAKTLYTEDSSVSNRKIVIFTDETVAGIYGKTVEKSLKFSDFQVFKYIFYPGEKSKNMEQVIKCLEFLADKKFNRRDGVIAVGGGIAGDIGGFVASIYMRGIAFLQVPTTLLAAVDASVGGKTGINMAAGKNLVGSFWQPSFVLCDVDTFSSLDKNQILDGEAEILKIASILDNKLYERLEKIWCNEKNLEYVQLVYDCVRLKAQVVMEDEKEKGIRKILNFGHTLGHAIEKYSNYTISHGKAVALGMCMMNRASERQGLTEEGTADRMENLLKKMGYEVEVSIPIKRLWEIACSDKKISGDSIDLVYLKKIGSCGIKRIKIKDMLDFF